MSKKEFNLSEKELGLTEEERDEIYFEVLEKIKNNATYEEIMKKTLCLTCFKLQEKKEEFNIKKLKEEAEARGCKSEDFKRNFNGEIKEIELERKIKELLIGTNFICMIFDKDLTMGEFLKQVRRKIK